ncbi:MAG: pyridoxal phosphate-dependent decarboxylase family protein [Actinomycetota bacterium]
MENDPERPLRLDATREEALARVAELVGEAWRSFDRFRPQEPPLDDDLRRLIEGPLPQDPTPVGDALGEAAEILDRSIAQARPRYFAFIGSSGLEVGALGDFLSHTYDINLAVDARAATVVEHQAVGWIAEFIGYPAAGGAFTSGGTISNVTALVAARELALPGARRSGMSGLRVAIYCSEEAHYSVTRAVELLGIGSDNLRAIAIDGLRRMRPDALAEAIDRDLAGGITPIAVVATAGTTLTGAVDPLAEIAEVCEARGVWLHVDGAYGLPAAAVRPQTFAGLARADSCSIDAHKWLYLPKACGVVLTRHGDAFAGAFAHEQGYLPHQRHELHGADITLEYSRPFRALKAWLAFRTHGAAQFRAAIERNLQEADLLYRHAQVTEDLEVLPHTPALSIVPVRHVPAVVADPNAHNEALARAIQDDGRVFLASALIDGDVWLRPCFVNYRTTEDDVLAVLEVARELGERLAGGET